METKLKIMLILRGFIIGMRLKRLSDIANVLYLDLGGS